MNRPELTPQQQLLALHMAAVLTTLRDVHPQVVPASMVYIALDMDIHQYTLIVGAMQRAGLVTISQHQISLTPLGIEKADAINAKLPTRPTTNTPPSNLPTDGQV